MQDDLTFVLTIVSALGCGLLGGVFFAFSVMVMPALERLPPAQGIAAMQSINIVAINRWFIPAFLGTALTCAVLIVAGVLGWGDVAPVYLLVGGGLYIIGALLVTMALNVPRNNALAEVDSHSSEGQAVWARYVPGWTALNTIRALTAFAASAVLTIGLITG